MQNKHAHFLVYKPYGMLSQFTPEQEGQRTLADLDFAFPKDAWPVGRLDADSEGLLLLSTDKRLNAALLLPKQQHPRTYWIQVEGAPTADAIRQLQQGVTIQINGQQHRTLPTAVHLLESPPDVPPRVPPIRVRKNIPDSWLEITLTEGKNRQVRRMAAAVGFPVLRLVRARIGRLGLGDEALMHLQPGMVIALGPDQLEQLMATP
jgi:23S rRNA pseudouridine2457 synthase